MKFSFLALSIAVFLSFYMQAQSVVTKRPGFIRAFENDSVHISYNEDYFLIEDSCADISRTCHYNLQERKFKGIFKDVSRLNPQQLIAAGRYDENGLKEGDFIAYYLNGNLQAKGTFKDNRFEGKWEFFYPTGRPKITFEANGNHVKIINTWTEDGKKIVDNGYGDYESNSGVIVWAGKLIGGEPDGKWIAYRQHRSEHVLVTERFKLGAFQKGHNQVGDYKDSSRIILVSAELLPLVKAEGLWTSYEKCGVVRKKYVVNARYPKGAEQFAVEIKDRLGPLLNKMNLSPFNEPIELTGKIMEDGRITFDAKNGHSNLTSMLIAGLIGLPALEPAWVDHKAVQQDLIVTIKYNSSVYSFSYRLLPIKTN